MNTKEDKHLEELIDQMMKNQKLETPPFDFTSKVMNQVLESKKSQAFTYKPLISKQTTLIILSIAIIAISFVLLNSKSDSSKWTMAFDLSFLYKNNLSEIFNFSKITVYTVVFGTLMLLGQITLLKNHFNHKN